jgi:glucose-1-phosphate thymidylyltransferase
VSEAATKAVILAGGLGTRMRHDDASVTLDRSQAAAATAGLKSMMPLGGRPFLEYVLSGLADAGYAKVCLITGPGRDDVRRHFEHDAKPHRLRISFAVQARPLGTANAVLAAEPFAGRDPFLVINSDNYYPLEALRALREGAGAGIAAFWREALVTEGNLTRERVATFPVVEPDTDGWLARLDDPVPGRPTAAAAADALISMNCWMLTPPIFEACRAIPPSASGEWEIQAAVRHAMTSLGVRFRVLPFRAPVLDLTARADVAYVAGRLAHLTVHV